MRKVNQSLQEYARGIAGGLLFSLPMLFTMEVWWTGFSVTPESLLLYIVVTFLLLIGYNRFAGMRHDASYREVIIDSVEELGLGIVLSFSILWVLDRIDPAHMDHQEIAGKVIVEAMIVAIGISIGTAQLGKGNGDEERGVEGDNGGRSLLSQSVMAVCGAILIGSSLAPTDEITMLAVEMSEEQTLILMLFSIILMSLILFYIDFANTGEPAGDHKALRVVGRTVYFYMLALLSACFSLWFFGHYQGNDILTIIKLTIVLGVASSLGASAGRLLLKGGDD